MATKKAVRFFCVKCGKEIWEGMSKEMKETTTIKEAEETALCWDCVTGIDNFKLLPSLGLSLKLIIERVYNVIVGEKTVVPIDSK